MSFAVRSPCHAKLPIKRLRCGACGEPPERLVEVGSISMTFAVSADGRYRDAEGVQREGAVEQLYAVCAHGHRWRMRGVMQVTSVDVGSEEEGVL